MCSRSATRSRWKLSGQECWRIHWERFPPVARCALRSPCSSNSRTAKSRCNVNTPASRRFDMSAYLPSGDLQLVQIVDSALAEAARKSGEWLVCRPGCTQCCLGPFPISQLDAARLRRGMAELQKTDTARAKRVRKRVRDFVRRFSAAFPGDPATGILAGDKESDAFFAGFANDEPCPALDPQSGLCDL